jgi:integrase
MSKLNSTATPPPNKPAKPYPDFPLTPHPAGYWCKRIRGKLYYFGPWADPETALANYNRQKDDLHRGRTPRPDPEALTVKDLINAFLYAKEQRMHRGELSSRTWDEYRSAGQELLDHVGKQCPVTALGPADFTSLANKLGRKWGVYRRKNVIGYIRSIFKHAYESQLIERPMQFGPEFKRPSKKTERLHRAKQGPKLFTPEEIRRLLDAAGEMLRAILLLGINCGFGNHDCGTLPRAALDLDKGWLDYPRPKTGIARRCPLWPETVAALRAALAQRPTPKHAWHEPLVFITKYGLPWAKDVADSPITKETRKLLDGLGINGHRNFYCLRHTFRTVADEAKDQPAADFLMGHESGHMSSVYRESIADERLRAVTDHVRKWLFAL